MLDQTFNVNIFKFQSLTQGSEAVILKGKRKPLKKEIGEMTSWPFFGLTPSK